MRGRTDAVAGSASTFSLPPVGVRFCKGVAAKAMAQSPSQLVLTVSDYLKVEGINATSNAAEMVNLQSPWDWAVNKFIAEAMNTGILPIDSDVAISVRV